MAQYVINGATGFVDGSGASANSQFTQITFDRKSSTTMGGYLTFDTGAIPRSAKNISVTATATLNITSDYGKRSNGSWTQCGARLTTGETNKGSAGELSAKTTDTPLTFEGGSFTRDELDDLRLKIIYTTNNYGSQDSAASLAIKNLQVTITYEQGTTYTVNITAGEGIVVDKTTEAVDGGSSFTLTITPQNGVSLTSATDNQNDILGALEQKVDAPNETVTSYPTSYSTSGSSISGTRYRNCIGKDSSTTASGNDYASGSSGSTSIITYTFDFSSIPENATITSVEVKVGGHLENTSRSTARLQLYSGNTAKGSESKFTTTSKQIITMTPGSWTRDELQNAQLRFTIGYYGGLVNGVDFDVVYTTPESGKTYYVYTISSVNENHEIAINLTASGPKVYMKVNGTWKPVYVKLDGVWQEAQTLDQLNGIQVYIRGD